VVLYKYVCFRNGSNLYNLLQVTLRNEYSQCRMIWETFLWNYSSHWVYSDRICRNEYNIESCPVMGNYYGHWSRNL